MKTGAVHRDDLLYLFANVKKAPLFGENDPEYAMIQRLTRFMAKFAKDGYEFYTTNAWTSSYNRLNSFLFHSSNPNSNTDRYLQNIIWTPMRADQFNYLDIDEFPSMRDHLNTERYSIWNRLFPIDSNTKLEIQEDEVY